jgi:hypothetical protein
VSTIDTQRAGHFCALPGKTATLRHSRVQGGDMRRAVGFIGCLGALSLIMAVATTATTDQDLSTQQELNAEATPPRPLLDTFGARIARGFEIAPVPLNLNGLDRQLVGLGSYIVNAQGGCNDCHTNPPYLPGGDPHLGQPTKINKAGYLGGGMHFGPIVSRNLTPQEHRRPAHLTFEQFRIIMRTGRDLDREEPHIPSLQNDLLQVMPWPVFRHMRRADLRAIYEYLRAIPSIPDDES